MRHLSVFLCLLAILCVAGCGKKKTKVPSWFQASGKSGETAKVEVAHRPASEPRFSSPIERQRWELNNHIVELDRKVQALNSVMEDLESERRETVRKLRDGGVVSSDDLKDNLLARTYAKNLHAVRQEIKATDSKRKIYKVTLEEGRAVLRRVDRQLRLAKAGVVDKEVEALHVAILEINERLKSQPRTPTLPAEVGLEAVVDEELRRFD